MHLYRLGPEGFFAAAEPGSDRGRFLHSDPYEEPPSSWRLGRSIDLSTTPLLVPVRPPKIIGVGRNYVAHARELDNPIPAEPVLFLKAPSAVIGPRVPIVLTPESERVELEGEIAVVLRRTLRQADERAARSAILGVAAACDITARDLQRRDPTFARAKSFDTFCPLGPAIHVGADLESLEVETRLNGETVQRGHVRDMLFGIVQCLSYISRMITLEPGDVVLTGTPEGVRPIAPGDVVEVEVSGLPPLINPVEASTELP